MSRDQLLTDVQAGLARFAESRDADVILDPSLENAVLGLLAEVDDTDVDAVYSAALVFYLRYHHLSEGRDQVDLQRAVALFRVVHAAAPERVPPDLRPAMPASLETESARTRPSPDRARAIRLCGEAQKSGDVGLVDQAIQLLRSAIEGLIGDAALRWELAVDLACAHAVRYGMISDPVDLDAQIDLLTACDALVSEPDADYVPQLAALGDGLLVRYRRAGRGEDADAAVAARQRVLDLVPEGDPSRGLRHFELGVALLARNGEDRARPTDLDRAVEHLRHACAGPVKGLLGCEAHRALGDALSTRAALGGDRGDLDEAIETLRVAARAAATSRCTDVRHYASLADAALQRTFADDDLADCDATVEMLRDLLMSGLIGAGERSGVQTVLGSLLLERHLLSAALTDLVEAVDFLRAAVDGAVRATVPAIWLDYAKAQSFLHRYTGNPAHRQEAIRAYSVLHDLSEAGDSLRAQATEAIADLRDRPDLPQQHERVHREALVERVLLERDAAPAGLRTPAHPGDRVITLTRRLVEDNSLAPHDRAEHLLALARYLLGRQERTGRADDALRAAQRALELSHDASAEALAARARLLVAQALLALHEPTGDLRGLDEAVAAAEAVPVGAGARSQLGRALTARYHAARNVRDLRRAVEVFQVDVRDDADPDDLRVARGNLGSSLRELASVTGDTDTLDEAIRLLQAAGARKRPIPTTLNLAFALIDRFQRTSAQSDLDNARALTAAALAATDPTDRHYRSVVVARCAVIGYTSDPELDDLRELAGHLDVLVSGRSVDDSYLHRQLGAVTWSIYQETRDSSGLDRALAAFRRSRDLAADRSDDAHRAALGFAHAVRARVRAGGSADELQVVARDLRVLLERTPTDEPLRGNMLVALVDVLRDIAAHDADEPNAGAVAVVIDELVRSTVVPPRIRAIHARTAVAVAADAANWQKAAELAELVVDLIPLLAPRTTFRADARLARPARVAADGAACWLNAGQPDRALLLLERGRAVVLTQTLTTRSELTALRRDRPALAERFDALRIQLDTADDAPASSLDPWSPLGPTVDPADLHRQLEQLLSDIRAVPGYRSFLLPPRIEDLVEAAAEGPVVLLNASRLRCDAVSVTSAGVIHTPLPAADIESLSTMAVQLMLAANVEDWPEPEQRAELRSEANAALRSLWDEVAGPVLDALAADDRSNAFPARIWWSVDSVFSLLLVHAAGRHDERGAERPPTVLDRTQSSYTPTVRSLVAARRSGGSTSRSGASMVVVSMPDTPGMSRLPGVAAETNELQRRTTPTVVLGTIRSASGPAAVSRVLDELPAHRAVHFACHAHADANNPAQSYLCVSDEVAPTERMAHLTLEDIDALHLTGPRLAFLSACATARPSFMEQVDDTVHLGSAWDCQENGVTDSG